ncbi:aryl-alcohol dehydrogenase-like predicted oxidoreductase [Microbacterium sp. SORGH_AS428]|uniref:aldo/keto reductase n=1 Tax=Microbacterium sp. SORGH_AS_0428 TaxID=3041788 RepID=UPI00285F7B12|nr:aldo/keto reductase [Microbacterium sp. SORGH_AS_0428]MDR6199934.1 aryl-alcohol dehydrogenase-like predicted oxidoreductase [Microbacterium sp. SORGH_AS_0428]
MQESAHTAQLGFGLAAVGRPAYITSDREHDLGSPAARSVAALQSRVHALLDTAWALGIRYVDAARSYGRAEEFLGSWLAAHPDRRSSLTIGSKWGYEYVGAWDPAAAIHERKEHTLAMLDRQWPETLAALGGPPDFYLIHSVTPDSPALADAALLERIAEIRDAGVRVGISTSGPRQAEVIDRARQEHGDLFSVVQSTWNVFEASAGPALERAHEAGWTVVLKEVLANGWLSDAHAPNALRDAARTASLTVDEYAFAVARRQEWADIVLSGAATDDQLRRGAERSAPDGILPMPSFAVDPQTYWHRRSALDWA